MENKLLEQPQWKLTQILLELEMAGLPAPKEFEGSTIVFVRFFDNMDHNYAFDFERNRIKYYRSDAITRMIWELDNRTETIEKLKELLK